MKANTTSPSHGALDAAERRQVAVPLAAEFAIVSTLVLIAAPVVLVGVTALRALMKSKQPLASYNPRTRGDRAGGSGQEG